MTTWMDVVENAAAALNEYSFPELVRKGKNIGDLFPTFDDRAKKVARNGGVRLLDVTPDVWQFEIASGTTAGKKYDAYVNFSNLGEILKKTAVNRNRVWNKDKTKLDYRKLADEIVRDTNLQMSCTCPSDLYYGFQYIRTQGDSNFPDAEDRAPNIRNKHKKGVVCKHLKVLLDALPFYISTMSAFLKTYYSDMITKIEDEVKAEFDKIKQTADVLKQKELDAGSAAQGGRFKRGTV